MRVMISGASGGGKSTLLSELARRGYAVVEEAASRVVEEELHGRGIALPWVDAKAFGQRALAMSIADYEAAHGLTFFDRGIVDASVAITARGGELPAKVIASHRYDRVYFAAPWPEIYEVNEERQHSLEKAFLDYERVLAAYEAAAYDPVLIPRGTVSARADFVVKSLLR